MLIRIFLAILLFTSSAASAADDAISANNNLGGKIFTHLASQNKESNIFFSPYSISSALNIAYVGSQKNTKAEFEKAYGIKPSKEYHSSYLQAKNLLDSNKAENQILNANALWVDAKTKLTKQYLETTKQYYGASKNSVNFQDSDASSTIINKWVEQNTNGKIKSIVSKNDINPLTRLIITNAIYFKGRWDVAFDKKLTKSEDFFLASGKTKKVDLMHLRNNEMSYAENDKLQAIELPYKGKDLSILIFLPQKNSMDNIIKNLNSEIAAFDANAHTQEINDIAIPKFKFETDIISLNTPLIKAGLKDAFSGKADFSGITGKQDLYISQVIHKAVIEVNEEGTEAAAATAVIMPSKAMMHEPKIINFIANKPFAFVIRDNKTKLVLFSGKISKP